MSWGLVNTGGIKIDDPLTDAWHAGSVLDMIKINGGPLDPFDDTILLATSDAGVWMLIPGSGEFRPLSMVWDNTHITCLANGPNGPHHIFAGCADNGSKPDMFGGALYETNTSIPASPLLQPWLKVPLPTTSDVGSIFDIVVLKNLRIIVLACRNGLWWSYIPIPGGGTYNWESAYWRGIGIETTACYSVTLGPGETIIVGAWSDNDTDLRGIFRGEFMRPLISWTPDKPVDRLVMYPTEIDMSSITLSDL